MEKRNDTRVLVNGKFSAVCARNLYDVFLPTAMYGCNTVVSTGKKREW